jgi:hypothetical protein
MTVQTLLPLLPDPDALLARCRALALLDFALDADTPTHGFVSEWRDGVDLAWRDNGSGDQHAVVFDQAGVFLHGFDHESDATPWRESPRAHWHGLLDGLPASLAHYPAAPEFRFDGFFDATVCVWRERGPDPGSAVRSSSLLTRPTGLTGCSSFSPMAARTRTSASRRTTTSGASTATP